MIPEMKRMQRFVFDPHGIIVQNVALKYHLITYTDCEGSPRGFW